MNIPGKHVKRTRFVETERFVVVVEVDAIIPDADPTEPCFGPETVQLLREVEKRAHAGDMRWLVEHGRVYERVNAA